MRLEKTDKKYKKPEQEVATGKKQTKKKPEQEIATGKKKEAKKKNSAGPVEMRKRPLVKTTLPGKEASTGKSGEKKKNGNKMDEVKRNIRRCVGPEHHQTVLSMDESPPR